jgi:hypothetical protein
LRVSSYFIVRKGRQVAALGLYIQKKLVVEYTVSSFAMASKKLVFLHI